MKSTLFSLSIVICTMLFLSGVQTANAELIMKDSTDFTWKYEMNVNPGTQDLDSLSGTDWDLYRGVCVVNGDGTVTMTDTDGDENYGTLRSSAPGDLGYNASVHVGNVWNNISDSTGFTIEASIKILGSGENDGLYFFADDQGYSKYSPLVVVADGTRWAGGTLVEHANNDGFHIFRIAQEADSNTYTVWRDGVLFGEGLTESLGVNFNRICIGDISATQGDYMLDYIRVTTGAYAPVPEPSALALLTAGLVGLLAYAWRKRK